MGYSYGAICNECGTAFEVNEGSGMIAMPFHCRLCGKEMVVAFRRRRADGQGSPSTFLRVWWGL